MPGLVKEERGLRALVAGLEEASKTIVSKMRTKRKTANMEMVGDQAFTERVHRTTSIAQ